jgi:ketosteroid isomerase-like protein
MSHTDLEALQELNRGYVSAAERCDVRWYDEHLAPDYVASNPDGSIADKAGFLARIAKPTGASAYETVEPKIRILGDVALIHAGFRCRKPDGNQGKGRYTDIWAKRGGRWLCVSAHFNLS